MNNLDIVYTWVDGNYPGYQEEYQKYCKNFKQGELIENIHSLKYSIRSIVKNFAGFRKIYLVTMRPQKPDWLIENDKFQIIHHDQIIEPQYLPTFNSNTIESRIHRIPGLSENFIYINDDFLVMKKTRLKHFMKRNRPLLFENIHYDSRIKEIKWFDFNSRVPKILYSRKFNVDPHVPTLIDKDCWKNMQKENSKDFEKIMSSRCNRECEYPIIYYLKYMKDHDLCKIVSTVNYLMNHLQFDINESKSVAFLLHLARIYRPRFLTLNSSHKEMSEAWKTFIYKWLEKQFPQKSPYELGH